jgi:hypothetical protein
MWKSFTEMEDSSAMGTSQLPEILTIKLKKIRKQEDLVTGFENIF